MKIYFLHSGLISFVRKDLEILRSAHEVRAECNFRKGFRNLAKNLKGILWSDMVFCWFASIHFLPAAVLAKILRRKLVIVTGGYDVADMPGIGYGSMRGGLKTRLARLLLSLADTVITFSNASLRETVENGRVPREKISMIYLGFDPPAECNGPKDNLVLTVGEVTWVNLKRKGLEDFARCAEYFPDVPFKLAGKWTDDSYAYLLKIAPANVEILGFVDDRTFSELLGRAKVYLQPSRHEGFGSSVAEAMLYQSIPVVSNVFSLPEVVGECGFLAAPGDMEGLREAVAHALAAEEVLGEAARDRIVKTFPLERRAQRLLEAVAHV